MLEQNIYPAHLTARGILRLLHSTQERQAERQFFKRRSNEHCMTARLSGSYLSPPFFLISAKKRQRIPSSSLTGISSKFLSSLRCTFHSLKMFSQIFVVQEVFLFCFLWVVTSSSRNEGNLSFALILLKIPREIEKLGNSSSLNSAMVNKQYDKFRELTPCFVSIG